MAAAVRVVSFNIQHGMRSDGTSVDVALAGAVAAGLEADVLALQEVDVGAPRSGSVDEAAEIAAACGMDHVFGHAAVIGGVGEYGNALAVRGDLADVEVKSLPQRRSRSEPRSVVLARAHLAGGVAATVAATHLSIHRDEVFGQLRAALDWLIERPGPWILVGDLNLEPAEVAADVERAGLTLADPSEPTFPVAAARLRIDHVAVGGGPRVRGVQVAPTEASDHHPLVVDIEMCR